MAEQTLNNPLSGAEIIEAMKDKIAAKMRTDCYLNPNSSYDWFTATVNIELNMHDSGSLVKADHVVKLHVGTEPAEVGEMVGVHFEVEAESPNKVRVETGQPVPTLTKDENGKQVVKGVRYGRKDAAKVK